MKQLDLEIVGGKIVSRSLTHVLLKEGEEVNIQVKSTNGEPIDLKKLLKELNEL